MADKEEPPIKRARTQNEPILKFRNYLPKTEALSKKRLPAKPAPSVVIEEKVEANMKREIQSKKSGSMNIAPTKANADLKRDIEKKLKKLARRTQRAIRELIKERLESENEDDTVGSEAHQID
eukprot:g792.t1